MQIRNGMFETNSSSSHSIIMGSGVPDYILPDELPNLIRVEPNDFEWGPEPPTNDFMTKLSYLMAYAGYYDDDKEKLSQLEDIVEDFTNRDVEFIPRKQSDDYYGTYGHIDHQSFDVAREIFESGKYSIINFLFNKKAYLVIDHDNH